MCLKHNLLGRRTVFCNFSCLFFGRVICFVKHMVMYINSTILVVQTVKKEISHNTVRQQNPIIDSLNLFYLAIPY